MSQTLRSASITEASSLLRFDPPLDIVLVFGLHGFSTWSFPLRCHRISSMLLYFLLHGGFFVPVHLRHSFLAHQYPASQVPLISQVGAHAFCTPAATWPKLSLSSCLSYLREKKVVLTTFYLLRCFIKGSLSFIFFQLYLPYHCRAFPHTLKTIAFDYSPRRRFVDCFW